MTIELCLAAVLSEPEFIELKNCRNAIRNTGFSSVALSMSLLQALHGVTFRQSKIFNRKWYCRSADLCYNILPFFR